VRYGDCTRRPRAPRDAGYGQSLAAVAGDRAAGRRRNGYAMPPADAAAGSERKTPRL